MRPKLLNRMLDPKLEITWGMKRRPEKACPEAWGYDPPPRNGIKESKPHIHKQVLDPAESPKLSVILML